VTPATRLKRIGVAAATAIVAINIWTGSPLLALWVGSRVQSGSDHPQMTSVLAVIAVLAFQSYVLTKLLVWLGAIDQELSGRPQPRYREPPPWLRSMHAGSARYPGGPRAGLTTIDRILVVVFVMAVLAMQFWFFFIAGTPLGDA
jgi:hypothetical protein